MGQLQEKYKHYREPQKFMEADVYPYFRAIEGKQGTEVEMGGHKVLMFGSNAYTGLTGDQRIIDAAKAALDKYGSGCAGSRFLNGTLDLHVQLEKEISEFIGKDDCLCFSTGFSVNQGVLAMVVGKDDYIICDDRDHASIVDGRRLSFAKQLHYKHNDMEDLERVLQKLPHEAIKLIVVDGVFSMEGDLAKLPEIVELKHKYNCSIMVDEAHGIGVFGRQGRGVCDHFGLTDEVDLIMGTFSEVPCFYRRFHRLRLGHHQLPASYLSYLYILCLKYSGSYCRSHGGSSHHTEGARAYRGIMEGDKLCFEAFP